MQYSAHIAKLAAIYFIQTRFLYTLLFFLALLPHPVVAQAPFDSGHIFLPFILKGSGVGDPNPLPPPSGPTIGPITTNQDDYPNSQIPHYDKFELTFNVNTIAKNLQFPYDPSPPPGLEPDLGITVDALFSPDNWQTVYTQPAFYYQEFEHEFKGGQDWIYPSNNFVWKVRFAPHQMGIWHFKLMAQDATGIRTTQPQTFTVVSSENNGFINVSQNDPRYFEYDDGTYFPALGYNLNHRALDWFNPVLANQDNFQIMSDNGLQLVRTWVSQWSIFGSAWNPWRSHNPLHQSQEPYSGLRHDAGPPFNLTPGIDPPIARSESEVFMWLNHDETVFNDGNQWNFTPCMVLGWTSPQLPVKRNTDYRIKVRYKLQDLMPQEANHPYGFTVKTGNWLWHNTDETQRCYYPGTGTLLAATYSTTSQWGHYPDPENADWQILEGHFTNGDQDFLDKLYLAIENAASGHVFIDYVWLEEDLGNGQYGPNIIYKAWVAQHQYFSQRNSYALDEILELANLYDIYLKLVILEKNDYILNILEYDGTLSTYFPSQNPENLFFGNGREMDGKTKIRWLQEAWWRYLQARWGYSPNVHSWELLNEGPPGPADNSHWILTDEFGKYMHCRVFGYEAGSDCTYDHPNDHLITTSFWASGYPYHFWKNTSGDYPDVDYADIHYRANQSNLSSDDFYDPTDFYDAALFSQKLSMSIGANQASGPSKPVMRGEVDWRFEDIDLFSQNAANGLWLHNFIWAGINSGGMIESYWIGDTVKDHIYETGSHDHRPMFKTFFNFIQDIPLSNGYYQDAATTSSETNLRAWGQKDLVNGCAHLWIQNINHTWKNVSDGVTIPPVSGTITILGFQPDQSFTVEWWNPYQPDKTQQIMFTETVVTQANGAILIEVDDLGTDMALKIIASDGCVS